MEESTSPSSLRPPRWEGVVAIKLTNALDRFPLLLLHFKCMFSICSFSMAFIRLSDFDIADSKCLVGFIEVSGAKFYKYFCPDGRKKPWFKSFMEKSPGYSPW